MSSSFTYRFQQIHRLPPHRAPVNYFARAGSLLGDGLIHRIGHVAASVPWLEPSLLLVCRGCLRLLGTVVLLLLLEEIARVSSPDGSLDAVMIREQLWSSLCSFGYSAFVVPRGEAAPKDLESSCFSGIRYDERDVDLEARTRLQDCL